MEPAANFRMQILRAIVLPPLLFFILSAVFFGLIVHLLSELDRVGQADRLIDRVNATSRLLVDRETARSGYLVATSPGKMN